MKTSVPMKERRQKFILMAYIKNNHNTSLFPVDILGVQLESLSFTSSCIKACDRQFKEGSWCNVERKYLFLTVCTIKIA